MRSFDVPFDVSLKRLLNEMSICSSFERPWRSSTELGAWFHSKDKIRAQRMHHDVHGGHYIAESLRQPLHQSFITISFIALHWYQNSHSSIKSFVNATAAIIDIVCHNTSDFAMTLVNTENLPKMVQDVHMIVWLRLSNHFLHPLIQLKSSRD